MKKKKHVGSTFESFLEDENIFEEVNAAAIKSIIARHLSEHMKKHSISKSKMADKLKTSRTGLERLLDPKNYAMTLLTINRVASVLGKKVNINLVNSEKKKKETLSSSRK